MRGCSKSPSTRLYLIRIGVLLQIGLSERYDREGRRPELPPRDKCSGVVDLEIVPLSSCPVFWDSLSHPRE